MPELERLSFVHSKVPAGNPLCSREKLPGSQGAMLWLLRAMATMELEPAEGMAWPLCWLKSTHNSRSAAVAGGSHPRRNVGTASGAALCLRNNRRLSLAEGRRSAQERNWSSSSFNSLIHISFKGGSQFLQAITISARGGIR